VIPRSNLRPVVNTTKAASGCWHVTRTVRLELLPSRFIGLKNELVGCVLQVGKGWIAYRSVWTDQGHDWACLSGFLREDFNEAVCEVLDSRERR